MKDQVLTREWIVDTWNDVPSDIVEANAVNSFKNKLDKYFGLQVYRIYILTTNRIWSEPET